MGVRLRKKKLIVKKDQRGWLAEILTQKDILNAPFGLLLVTTAHPGQTKGNHYHKRKREWYCVVKGRGLLKVWSRDNSKMQELEIGEKNMMWVEIPTGYFHSIKNIGKDEFYLIAYVSEPFNPQDPDTYYE